MLSSWPSPSVLTLGCPRRALSRVHFVSPCSPFAPLPPPCIGTRLTHPWCRCAHLSGRCPSSSPMVPLPSSSRIGFCDGHASAQWTTSASACGWVSVTCDACSSHGPHRVPTGRHHRRRCLITHAQLAAAPVRALAPVPPCAQDLLRGRSIWYYLSIFFFSPYPRTVYCDSVIPSVCAGVMVHTALQSCARPQSSSSLPSTYLYALFFSFPSPFPFPPHLSSMTLILSFVKLVCSPG
jgi:hypothetical protein